MAIEITTSFTAGVAKLSLSGELDAAAAVRFKAEIEKALARSPSRVVLLVKDLSFMASAGLRVLVYIAQKMAPTPSIYIVSPQPAIVDTLQKTGFDRSVTIVSEYTDDVA